MSKVYVVSKTVEFRTRVTLPENLSEEEITDVIYDIADGTKWEAIEVTESDWEPE